MRAHEWLLLAVVAGGTVLAVWGSDNTSLAEASAGVALSAAAAWAALALLERLPKSASRLAPERYDHLELLRDSFDQGLLGRQAILSTISGLEADVLGDRRPMLSLEEEARLNRASPREFRAWLDGRLTELERAS